MQENIDILASLDAIQEPIQAQTLQDVFENKDKQETLFQTQNSDILEESETQVDIITSIESEILSQDVSSVHINQSERVEKKTKNNMFGHIIFLVKYFATSATIFAALLLVSNYHAYWNIAKSIIYSQELTQTKNSLIDSVAAANLKEDTSQKQEMNTFKQLSGSVIEDTSKSQKHSMAAFVAKNDTHAMPIEITPYENRIVIPKIGKNIPLVDITHTSVSGQDELNDIFMDELENGVVRYPGSAKPGQVGNSFIFGHSSNFPWIEGKYNDVFALLDKVSFDDEIIVYYGQQKFTYKIRAKNVIRPGDVSVLKNNTEAGAKEISLMTCWPVGTTLNRLVLTGELIETK